MAKNKHSFAKRQREIEKKRKAEEKLLRRRNKNKVPEATADLAAELEGSESTPEGLPPSPSL
jgi:hypothetical protein